MRDEETGSWWQQVTGEAILGPLKGKRLKSIFHDELTFATWKSEQPSGRVLRPDNTSEWKEFSANWEEETGRMAVVTKPDGSNIPPRTIMVGIKLNGEAKAYPLTAIEKQTLVLDSVGGVPVLLLIGEDKKSIRAFEASIAGQKTEFFLKADQTSTLLLTDGQTGSEWDFTGRTVAGPSSGQELKKIPILKDYWFDWKTYNPQTKVYNVGVK